MKPLALLDRFDAVVSLLQSPLLLVLRLYWGWSFVQTGWGKFGRIDEVAKWFGEELHLPAPKLNAVMAASTELVGGALLAVGLGARLVSVPLAFTMVVAYATADREALQAVFSDPDKFTGAAPFLFLLVAVIVLAFGPGKISVDHFWRRRAGAAA